MSESNNTIKGLDDEAMSRMTTREVLLNAVRSNPGLAAQAAQAGDDQIFTISVSGSVSMTVGDVKKALREARILIEVEKPS